MLNDEEPIVLFNPAPTPAPEPFTPLSDEPEQRRKRGPKPGTKQGPFDRKRGPKPGTTKGPRVDRGKIKESERRSTRAGATPPEEFLGPEHIRVSEMRFADCFLRGMTYSNAYRETHDTHDLTDNVIANKASMLMKTERVQLYLNKVRNEKGNGIHVHVVPGVNDTSPIIQLKAAMDEMRDSSLLINAQSQIKKMELIYWYALVAKQYSAAISAADKQSELVGLKVDRKEITVKRMSDLSRDEQLAAIEDSKKELMELGYDPKVLDDLMAAAQKGGK